MTSFCKQLSRVLLVLLSEQGGGYGASLLLQGMLSCVLIQIPALTIRLWLDSRCRKDLHFWWNAGIWMLLKASSPCTLEPFFGLSPLRAWKETLFLHNVFLSKAQQLLSFRNCFICFGVLGNWLPLEWVKGERAILPGFVLCWMLEGTSCNPVMY